MFQRRIVMTSPVMILCSHCKPRLHDHKIRHFSLGVLRSCNAKASVATQERDSRSENQLSLLNHKTHLQRKTLLKIKRTPFLKTVFIGKFDKDVLAFPEIHDNKEIEAINKMSDQVRKYVLANVDSEQIDRTSTFPQTVLNDMKRMGLFGSRIPKEYGGLGLTATEHVRLMEACSVDSSLPVLLNSHHSIAAQGFLSHASEELRSTYLPKLATGELTAAFGFSEQHNENDISCVHTVANRIKGNNHYLLNGKKTWVVNAENADLFLVLAKNVDPESPGVSEDRFAAFVVDRDLPGISIHKAEKKLGIKGASISSVEFNQTPVPLSNIIGSGKNGHEVLRNILMMNRFHIGAFTSGQAKALVEIATDYCINTNLYKKPLMEYESTKHIVGRIIRKAYEMESISYLAAGLYDSTEEPDLDLEYSAIKVFCTEGLWYCANELQKLIGPTASLSGHPVERVIRDTQMWLMFEGPNNMIRQYITVAALNYLKGVLADDVQKLRNPMFFPRFSFKKFLADLRHERGNLKLRLDLQGYLHPNLQMAANLMEFSVQKLKHALEIALQNAGPGILLEDVTLEKLAEMAIEIFVMAAVCSRSSRAYCIGLPCAGTEVTIATACCQDGYEKVLKLHDGIVKGPATTTDKDLTKVSKVAFFRQGYCLTPPFSRTY